MSTQWSQIGVTAPCFIHYWCMAVFSLIVLLFSENTLERASWRRPWLSVVRPPPSAGSVVGGWRDAPRRAARAPGLPARRPNQTEPADSLRRRLHHLHHTHTHTKHHSGFISNDLVFVVCSEFYHSVYIHNHFSWLIHFHCILASCLCFQKDHKSDFFFSNMRNIGAIKTKISNLWNVDFFPQSNKKIVPFQ